MATLGRAIAIAAEAHSGQFDKAGAPYILHPLRVMLSLSTEEERIVGVLHDLVEDCEEWTFERLSHNHPDAVEASQAVALSIFLARQGISKNEIAGIIRESFSYDLSTIEEEYSFDLRAKATVERALAITFASSDWETSVRRAIMGGGDTDTVACIAGAVAEALYGIPDEIAKKARSYLTQELDAVIDNFLSK